MASKLKEKIDGLRNGISDLITDRSISTAELLDGFEELRDELDNWIDGLKEDLEIQKANEA